VSKVVVHYYPPPWTVDAPWGGHCPKPSGARRFIVVKMQVGPYNGRRLQWGDIVEAVSSIPSRIRSGYTGGVRDWNDRIRAGKRPRAEEPSVESAPSRTPKQARPSSYRSDRTMPFRARRGGPRVRRTGNAVGYRSGGAPPRGRRTVRRRYNGRRKKAKTSRRVKRRTRQVKYSATGSTKVSENGGIVAQTDVAYIGVYSSPVVQVVESVSRALYRALMKEAGIDFGSWTERHRFHGEVNEHFIHVERLAVTSTPATGATLPFSTFDVPFDNITTAQTHGEVADLFNVELWKVVEAGIPITLQEVQLIATNWDSHGTLDVKKRTIIAQLRPRHLKLHITCTNKLEIQNRTKAADVTATATEQANESMLNIANNPVTGYLYQCSGAGFGPKSDDYGRAEYALRSEPKYGVIRSSSIGGNTTVTVQQELYNYIKPPKPSFFQKTIGKKITLAPGAMTSTVAVYKKSMPLNDIFVKYLPTMQLFNTFIPDTTSYRYPYTFGQSKMFALERMLDSRDSSDNQLVNIGYEHNLSVSSVVTKVQQFIAPINDVVA